MAVTALLMNAGTAYAGPLDNATAVFQRGDYVTTVAILRPLAAQGKADAQHFLAGIYAEGKGVAQDEVIAAKWYRLAAAQGKAAAQYDLGSMYDQWQAVAQDYEEAIK